MAVVHLVRDPRASVFSWRRRPIPLLERDPHGKWRAVVRTLDGRRALIDWLRANGSASLLKSLGLPYLRLRYESLVRAPAPSVSRIASFMRDHGLPIGDERALLAELTRGQIVPGERHLIGSNPGVKSKAGPVRLREDAVWLRESSRFSRLLQTMILLPWLLAYGYSLWPRDRRQPDQHAQSTMKTSR